jgi:hypothetical protein
MINDVRLMVPKKGLELEPGSRRPSREAKS